MTNISLNTGYNQYRTPYEEQRDAERKERMGIKDPSDGLFKDKNGNKVKDPKEDKGSPFYECETCKNRKYQDGSDEMVSFKTAQHISPQAAMSAVMGHEQEHVSNAYSKAAKNNGKVINASVTIKTAVCPECGRSYVAGGETRTQIKYYNEDNPYQKDLALQDQSKYAGMNVDGKA